MEKNAMIARTFIMLWLTGVLFLPVSAQAVNDYKLKPGAAGELCLSCHEAFKAGMESAYVHEPIAKGECSKCHNPHASNHGDLLYTEPERICLDCHKELLADAAISIHPVAAEGNCTSCHDPHTSMNR